MVSLGELMMILELHRQGLKVSAIARQLGQGAKAGPSLSGARTRRISLAFVRLSIFKLRIGMSGLGGRSICQIKEIWTHFSDRSVRPKTTEKCPAPRVRKTVVF